MFHLNFASYITDHFSLFVNRHTFAMMSFIAETFIFLYVGMDAFDIEKWRMSKLRYYFLNVELDSIIFRNLLCIMLTPWII